MWIESVFSLGKIVCCVQENPLYFTIHINLYNNVLLFNFSMCLILNVTTVVCMVFLQIPHAVGVIIRKGTLSARAQWLRVLSSLFSQC